LHVAVVGHIEWVRFLRLSAFPRPGQILHADDAWDEAAGGGSVAAVELSRLAGSCLFFTALGNDAAAAVARQALEARGVRVRAAARPAPQRRATTLIGPEGDRAIIVQGPAFGPSARDALGFEDLADCDAVYICKADPPLVRLARQARVLVATARMLPVLREAGVQLDVLVRSAHDENESFAAGDLDPAPRHVVSTEGACGGVYESRTGERGRWEPEPLSGPLRDTYGAGDSFAAGLCYALGDGLSMAAALRFAARRGALALCRPGAHGDGGAATTAC
jgi:ribokinase